jgi:hypothetical protein
MTKPELNVLKEHGLSRAVLQTRQGWVLALAGVLDSNNPFTGFQKE